MFSSTMVLQNVTEEYNLQIHNIISRTTHVVWVADLRFGLLFCFFL